MKLDRNITVPRRGKYALILLRKSTVNRCVVGAAKAANKPVEVEPPAIDFGDTDETDFFVIRLKDRFAAKALRAYAYAAENDDMEYANEVHKLADLSEALERRMPD